MEVWTETGRFNSAGNIGRGQLLVLSEVEEWDGCVMSVRRVVKVSVVKL